MVWSPLAEYSRRPSVEKINYKSSRYALPAPERFAGGGIPKSDRTT